jgi:hypothetical protein
MNKEITTLGSPIDVMHLIHKALKGEAERVVAMADDMATANDLKAVKESFNFWATALGYHAVNEDKYMTGPIANSMIARENEEEHARLGQRIGNSSACFDKEFSDGELNIRGHRHFYGCVVALQVAQNAHLEEEVEFVLPLVKERMSKDRQREVARRLLWDEAAKDKRWVAAWVSKNLTSKEKKLLADLEEELAKETVKGIHLE